MTESKAHKEDVESFITATMDNRLLQQRDRDYYDGKQYTEEQEAKLCARGQAPTIVNRVKPKAEGLIGLYIVRNTDPKAYPRTKKHEKAAHAITDALRYVADNTDFDQVKAEVAENFFIEGVVGAIVDVKQNARGEIDINIDDIPADNAYYDPFSRKKDFSDAEFKGICVWKSINEIKRAKPDVNIDELLSSTVQSDDFTFEDHPTWIDKKNKRVKVCLHFYLKDDVWWMHYFTDGMSITEPQESPFLDEFGAPTCPIELVSAHVDRENNRYSEVRGFISGQDEINFRRSKALHLLSQRQTISRLGTFADIPALKRELSKPDGHVEYKGEQGDFDILQTGDMTQGQLALYQDAKTEMDAVSVNAQMSGERQGNLSGKAIDRLQSAGMMELNRQYNLLSSFELRIYRQVWARIKQFWNEEKWIRVTDDHDNLRWVGLNSQVTVKQLLEETMEDESQPQEMRIGAAVMHKQMTEQQDPKLQEIVEVRNDTAEIDADIKLDQSYDVVNIQQEQFEILAKFGQGSDIDIIELIELSEIRGKDDLIEKIEQRRKGAAQANGNIQQIQAQEAEAKTAKIMSEVQKNTEEAIQKKIENTILVNDPSRVSSISV